MALVTAVCRPAPSQEPRGSETPAEAARTGPECELAEVRSNGVFKIHFANEWATGHVVVIGCKRDLFHLKTVAELEALQAAQAVAERSPEELPYCGHAKHNDLAAEANKRYGRLVIRELCVDAVADI